LSGIDVEGKDIYHLISIENDAPGDWDTRFMQNRRNRILNRVPFAEAPVADLI